MTAASRADVDLGAGGEPRFTLSQISTLLGLLGLVFLVGVGAYMAWNERRTLFAEGQDHAEQEAYFLAEHAQRLFEVSDIALKATAAATVGKDWATIAQAPDILANMRELNDMLPYVDVLLLADATGQVRSTTLDGPPAGYSIADRSVFKEAAQTPGDALLIGDPILGHVSGKPTFLVARRLDDAEGHFRGIAAVSMSLTYFTAFWSRLETRNDERVAMVRGGNGSILARYPEGATAESNHLLGESVTAAVAHQMQMGPLAPTAHQSGYFHRIGNLSAYVAVVYRNAVITDQWTARLLAVLPFFGAACLALLSILLIGWRLARREAIARRDIDAARALLAASNVRLEQRVAERTADLQETNEEIQRFAYIVSHDLRAPLVNIMGFTSELTGLRDQIFPRVTGSPELTSEEAQVRRDFDEALGFIQSSIDKMDRLIKAILSLSRQGQRKLKPEPLDMDAVMQSIVDGVAHRVMQSGATVTVGMLPPLVADRIAVEQIFSNLVDNAVKYLKPDTPGAIAVQGTASATTVTYEVRDNGRGIDEKDRERVFELFRRAGRQDQPGEGIGLANVRSLVRRLGGTITLDGRLGSGCVFTVTLPKFGTESEIK